MEDPNMDLNFQKLQQMPVLTSWMQWFLSLEDHDFLIEIDRDFISDKMNLLNLRDNFPSKDRYNECLRLILSNKVPNSDDLQS
jgi:CRISPR/Cas system-associated protein Cas10 (large subunit of type III CRISPR-Cas system)